jgi:hypothetical protein
VSKTAVAESWENKTPSPVQIAEILRLHGAWLRGEADGARANLAGAYLAGETRLPAGFAGKLYLSELVPALLTAGGKKLEEVANSETWGCHSWGSEGRELACPIATAFDVHQISDVPILYREQANFFIQVFDAKLVPLDAVLGKPAEVVAE